MSRPANGVKRLIQLMDTSFFTECLTPEKGHLKGCRGGEEGNYYHTPAARGKQPKQ